MKKKSLTLTVVVLAVIVLAILAVNCITMVPTGYTGILTTFGKVEENTLEAGFHIKSPFQQVIKMDNRTQKYVGIDVAFSSDIQQVDISYSINYSIDKATAMTLYKEVGQNYFNTIVLPRLVENVKSSFAKYTADKLIAERGSLSTEISTNLKAEMADYGVNVINVNIENIDFTDAFTTAVEQKQVAEQTKLKAQTEQAQKTMEAEENAKRLIIAAEADAEVQKIQAEAAQYAGEREAEMNRKLGETLTPELVQYYYANKWNGELPTYMGGESTIPVLNFGDTEN